MSTQPLSPDTTTILPPLSSQSLLIKGRKESNLRKRTARPAKKVQAKSARKPRVTKMDVETSPVAELLPVVTEPISATPEVLSATTTAVVESSLWDETCATAHHEVQAPAELQLNDGQVSDDPPAAPNNQAHEFPVIDDIAPLPVRASSAGMEDIQAQPTAFEKKSDLTLSAKSWVATLMQLWDWLRSKVSVHPAKKRLRVCESVSLGEKRFVAVIQVDGQQFLVGGSSTSISTLAQLEPSRDFASVLQRSQKEDACQV